MSALAERPPLDFRFLDIMTVLLVLTGGLSALVVVHGHSRQGLRILSTTLPDAIVGRAYELKLIASGGQEPYLWSASGLPDGMEVRADGTLTGSPSRPGSYQVSLTVADQGSNDAT